MQGLDPVYTTIVAVVGILVPLLQILVCVRILLRPHRDPAARVAWLVVVGAIPILGMLAYLLVGEVRAGKGLHRARRPSVVPSEWPAEIGDLIPDRYRNLFLLGESINGFAPVTGNKATFFADSDATIDALVADIDRAAREVHLCFYIWLADRNGKKVVEAVIRAARRGVICRVLADDLGSRTMVRSLEWSSMRHAGVKAHAARPIGNLLIQVLLGRVDMRNHRKVVVIDGETTYCGSQNCADPEFLPKARYGPWVDLMVRFEGPIALQNQTLFAQDWRSATSEELEIAGPDAPATSDGSLPALVIGTGASVRYSAMSEIFEALFFTARHELIITTPYYVPDEALQSALRASAYRGVETTLILPAKNDSWIVAAASRSYYADLISAGVRIYEYHPGLLHTKSITVDGELTLIGSANLDRRSFELNSENNILFYDADFTSRVRGRQLEYLKSSSSVKRDAIARWSVPRRVWNNAIATLGPLL